MINHYFIFFNYHVLAFFAQWFALYCAQFCAAFQWSSMVVISATVSHFRLNWLNAIEFFLTIQLHTRGLKRQSGLQRQMVWADPCKNFNCYSALTQPSDSQIQWSTTHATADDCPLFFFDLLPPCPCCWQAETDSQGQTFSTLTSCCGATYVRAFSCFDDQNPRSQDPQDTSMTLVHFGSYGPWQNI